MKNQKVAFIGFPLIMLIVFFSGGIPAFGESGSSEVSNKSTGETAEPLTLDFCIETALKNNPDLKFSGVEKQIAASDRQIVSSERWPYLKLKAGITEYVDDQRLVPASFNGEKGVFGQNMADIGLAVRMPLFVGGRIIHSIRAAELNETASIQRFTRNGQELRFNVTSAFYTILGQQRQLTSIGFSKEVLQQDRLRIEALIQAQKAAAVDLFRMDVRLAQVEEQMVRVRNAIHVAYRVLFNLMGLETGFSDPLPPLTGSLQPIPPMPDYRNAFQDALANRPDFQALTSQLDAQMAKVNAVRGQRWPAIYLEGVYGWRKVGEISDQPDGADSAEDVGSVGLKMEVPLFEGGRIQTSIRRELEKASGLRHKLSAMRLRIQKEVETAIFNMESSKKRIDTQEAAIAQAREVLRIEQEKYRLGKGTILDVLDSQRALLDVETGYYQALADYHIATRWFRLTKGDE